MNERIPAADYEAMLQADTAMSEDVLDQKDNISLQEHKEELSQRRKAFLYE